MYQATCPGQLRCLGQNFFQTNLTFFEQATCPGQLRCLGQIFSQKNRFSGVLEILCAEQAVGNLKKWTFRNSGTPVRRTRRRKSQKVHFQESWDSYAQNKTPEISKNALSGAAPGGGRGQPKSAKVKECCSKTSFSELSTGTGSSPRGGGGQQKSAKVKESCSKTSFL